VGLGLPTWLWVLSRRSSATQKSDPGTILGVASGAEVKRAAGRRWLLHRAESLRPSLQKPQPSDVGCLLGRARRLDCFCSVEDSIVLLGPPRSGKGLHLVIPSILDAPGAVITTSTRPDNLTATLRAREAMGPVAVFDPQRLAPGIRSSTRWSPIRGCENPQIALLRAKALASGAAGGTVDSNFWQASSEQAVRCLLHAAALGGRTPTGLYRWSLSAVQAREAVAILAADPRAALSWDESLESIVTADPRQRDAIEIIARTEFSALTDPRVLEALSPAEGGGVRPRDVPAGRRARCTCWAPRPARLPPVAWSARSSRTSSARPVASPPRRLAAAFAGAGLDPFGLHQHHAGRDHGAAPATDPAVRGRGPAPALGQADHPVDDPVDRPARQQGTESLSGRAGRSDPACVCRGRVAGGPAKGHPQGRLHYKGRKNAGSLRTPLRHAHQAHAIWQY